MILEIPAELAQRLEAQAEAQGQEAQFFALSLLERGTQESTPNLTPRQRAVRAAYGMFAGDGRTVDDFLKERHEEAEREMQATNARHAAMAQRQASPEQMA